MELHLAWWSETLQLGPLELAAVGLSAAIIGIIAWVRYVALGDPAADGSQGRHGPDPEGDDQRR